MKYMYMYFIFSNNFIKLTFYMAEIDTVDGFIFVGTNLRGLKKNDAIMGIKIRGHNIFFNNSYR